MTNIRGLDPIPRGWDDAVPRDERAALESIRRAANAVRVLNKRRLPDGAARKRMADATASYEQLLNEKQQRWENPPLF
uniref:Uncharacterized protein n=1 Tax=uncultured prokaryote TaxID=198431 RepID=A0A0H5Q469_9ZZZZ|nr:hypothetical protein [uncultured prokaryote]